MDITIDESVRQGGAQPFLLVWAIPAAGAGADSRVLEAALRQACETAAGGPSPDAETAIGRYQAELVKLGRNPNRYRISSDALMRRCRRDGAIPSILPLVDLNNIISLRTGWPVGCYDPARIVGDMRLRLGRDGETMTTLGKGEFDIARLPVLCDAEGPFGSTVSDSSRTAVTGATEAALFVMYGYGEADAVGLAAMVSDLFVAAGLALSAAPRMIRA